MCQQRERFTHTERTTARALTLVLMCIVAAYCAERAGWCPVCRAREAVVFTTIRPPSQDIYLYERRGEAPRRPTDHPALDYNAAFSPDGRWLVFTSERAAGGDLYALDLGDGGTLVRLTRHHVFDAAAAFSPDGTELAFVSTREGDADIFVMRFAPEDPAAAEAAAANLTRRPGGDLNPLFSPDGRRIAFSRQDTLWSPHDLGAGQEDCNENCESRGPTESGPLWPPGNGREDRAKDPRTWPTGGAVRHVPGNRGAVLPALSFVHSATRSLADVST
jgi:Tol biopolymer transport system component